MAQPIFITQSTLEQILEQSKAQTGCHPDSKIFIREENNVLSIDYLPHDKLNDLAVPAINSLMGKL